VITPHEFAQRHLGHYKIQGPEIIPMYCPYCKGNGKDKYTFALNVDKQTFNCKRGSCGKQGHFTQLCKDFGEEAERTEYYQPPKIYKPPQTILQPITNQAEEYLKKRKISKATLDRRKVGCDNNGNIIFSCYENNKAVMVKFRPARKVEKGERKSWREEGGKPVLWGMEICAPGKPLLITEGEIDALTLDECGIPNAVSVPSGAEDMTWIENCWEWLEQFKSIILFGDNDEPGKEMVRKLIIKLGEHRCSIVEHEYKDANELLYFKGKEAVISAFNNAKEVPINGLLRLSEVKYLDIDNILATHSGISALDRFTNGFMMGQVSVWTGTSAAGKSSFIGQMLAESVNQGFGVCAFSGELPASLFKYWVDLQIAGEHNLVDGKITPEAKRKINAWYKDRFFLYDSFGSVKSSDILKVFEMAAKRHDCKVFLVDNLMTTDFSELERDWYHGQSMFVGKIVEFAHKFDVHVHVVAHPRKVSGRVDKMDVSGTADITNRADNVFCVSRVSDEDIKQNPELNGCSTIVTILKSRFTGKQDIDIGLKFYETCKRFTPLGAIPKKYGWEKTWHEMGEEVEGAGWTF